MFFPHTCLDFLGITIDTIHMEFRLPHEIISRIKDVTEVMLSSKKSLLGIPDFAACVIPVRRVFARSLYSSTKGLYSPVSHIRISKAMKEDLRIWHESLCQFNGHFLWQAELAEGESLGI
ncbi:unnamed protein product [Ranitomeya imitator]|uniref:Uncharacterized protein n=1 Tax=Ranitomeya imitator TaxID=111125 RepID=A0ABN9LSJ9_9NEOB|nr:unnamed protein product [Ranitomeya imitator]